MPTYLRWLAHPQALPLLLALPLLAVFALLAWLTRRRGGRLLGIGGARVPLASRLAIRRFLRALVLATGLALVGVAAAGPHWGRDKTAIVSAARDLVVLLDVSRSMLADTPSRQLRAQRILSDLANTLKQRGGHRVALVVVAAKAQLVVPLTTDYDLFQEAALQQDAARLPAELRPGKDGPPSGTRLGQGLQQAIGAHDPKYHGSQVILLVSDGDDPAGDDEWKDGANAARRAGIPVFVVGVGDPTKPSSIRVGDNLLPLTFGGKPVETTLNEEVLKEIARRTDGTYFPVRTESIVPGTLFPAVLEAATAQARESPPADDYHPRFRWFLTAGLVMLVLSLFVGDRRLWRSNVPEEEMDVLPLGETIKWRAGGRKPPEKERQGDKETRRQGNRETKSSSAKPAPLAFSLSPCLLVSLSPSRVAALALVAVALAGAEVESLLRQGSDAFQKKDYAAALKFFEQAEDGAPDPGLVAFNKGATLIRLGRLREAELSYLRCLQDRVAPAERRLKALYNLGTALLQRGADTKDAGALFRAADCFELCFKEATGDQALQADAEHNLELARLLWLKVRAETKAADDMLSSQQDPTDPRNKQFGKAISEGGDQAQVEPSGSSGDHGKPGDKDGPPTENKLPGPGTVETLADTDELQPLDGSDARELLAREIRRIQREQARGPGHVQAENRNVKDW